MDGRSGFGCRKPVRRSVVSRRPGALTPSPLLFPAQERERQAAEEKEQAYERKKELKAEVESWRASSKGNLRTLLATMDRVLWPECEWKQGARLRGVGVEAWGVGCRAGWAMSIPMAVLCLGFLRMCDLTPRAAIWVTFETCKSKRGFQARLGSRGRSPAPHGRLRRPLALQCRWRT